MSTIKTPPIRKLRLKAGDIVTAALPQVDGKTKDRPALVLRYMPTGQFLACAITTQLHKIIPEFEEIIRSSDEDFSKTGLKADSLIRVTALAVFQPNDENVRRIIGHINPILHQKLLSNLCKYLIQDPNL